MSENYLMLNGKRIELTAEQVKTLTAEEKKQNPFERVENNNEFYVITARGTIQKFIEHYYGIETDMFSVGNYCTDKALMEQRALHETLNRLLWRYAEEHGGDNEWNSFSHHWHIVKNGEIKTLSTQYYDVTKRQGTIYFKDEKTAQSAIEEIVKPFMAEHPEFVW